MKAVPCLWTRMRDFGMEQCNDRRLQKEFDERLA